jgi:hypothetical protein
MQRLGAIERTAEYVLDLLDRAEEVDPEYVVGGDAYRVGGVTIVVDPSDDPAVVTTLFRKEVANE